MRIAHIEGNTVSNLSVGDSPGDNQVNVDGIVVAIGDLYLGGSFSAPVPPLLDAMAEQLNLLQDEYQSAIQMSVVYNGATFQADKNSQNLLVTTLAVLNGSGVPSGFGWLDIDNHFVPMGLSQLQGLAATMFAQGWEAFQNLQSKKAAVRACTTSQQVQAITWG